MERGRARAPRRACETVIRLRKLAVLLVPSMPCVKRCPSSGHRHHLPPKQPGVPEAEQIGGFPCFLRFSSLRVHAPQQHGMQTRMISHPVYIAICEERRRVGRAEKSSDLSGSRGWHMHALCAPGCPHCPRTSCMWAARGPVCIVCTIFRFGRWRTGRWGRCRRGTSRPRGTCARPWICWTHASSPGAG